MQRNATNAEGMVGYGRRNSPGSASGPRASQRSARPADEDRVGRRTHAAVQGTDDHAARACARRAERLVQENGKIRRREGPQLRLRGHQRAPDSRAAIAANEAVPQQSEREMDGATDSPT